MTKIAFIVLLLALLAAPVILADSQVTNVELSHAAGKTVARIDMSGEVRFSHQTEIAKDGRPYRVIVDLLSATHHLGAKNFLEVPSCIVTGVRTSQYAVRPEKVVRVVFDITGETVYQIAAQGNSVRVTFPDAQAKPFVAWSSTEVVKQRTSGENKGRGFVAPQPTAQTVPPPAKSQNLSASQLNGAIDQDRLASLGTPQAKKTDQTVRPKASAIPAETKKATSKLAKLEQPAPKAPKPALSKELAASAPPVSPAVSQPNGTARKFSDSDMWAVPVHPQVTSTPKPVVKPVGQPTKPNQKLADKPQAKPSKPLAAVNDPQPKAKVAPVKPSKQKVKADVATKTEPGKVVQKADDKQNTKSKKKATSRFRRSPQMSKKMKGTMVAEFPKRLVIKYKTQGKRDPFATLINEARVQTGLMEERIPNVDGLRLVGVAESQDEGNSALFEDTEGYGYILKAGDKVRSGYVLRIEEDRVYFQIFEYGWSRTVALNIED